MYVQERKIIILMPVLLQLQLQLSQQWHQPTITTQIR